MELEERLDFDTRSLIHHELANAAYEMGKVFSNLPEGYDVSRLKSSMRYQGLVWQHQQNEFDQISHEIAVEAIESVFRMRATDTSPKLPLDFGIRFEHVNKIIPPKEDSRYWLLTSPIDGNTNFLGKLESRLDRIEEGTAIKKPLTSDSCVTLAFVDSRYPFEPLATAVYDFSTGIVHSSLLAGDGYQAFIGEDKGRTLVNKKREIERYNERRINRFIFADFVNNFKTGPALLAQGLYEYGREKGTIIEPIGYQPSSTSAIINLLTDKNIKGYIDGRSQLEFPPGYDSPINEDHAVLLYSNIVAVVPIAIGHGLLATDIDGKDFRALKGNIDFSSNDRISANERISLAISLPEFYQPGGFNLIEGLRDANLKQIDAWNQKIGISNYLK